MQITAAPDYETLAAHVAAHGTDPRPLDELTAWHDGDLHQIWLDGVHVWHAYSTDSETGTDEGGGWALEHERATQALGWIAAPLQALGVLDRLADGSLYDDFHGRRQREQDLQAWEEYQQVLLASLAPAEATPAETDRAITEGITTLRNQMRLLAALRAEHIRDVFGTARGAQSAAAAALGASTKTISTVLSADDQRWRTWQEASDEATAAEHGL